MRLSLDSIIVSDRRRDLGDVSDLVESIGTLGLLNPITVKMMKKQAGGLSDEMAPHLLAGRRRLEACRQLGWADIEANVVEVYDLDLALVEIDENLIREELTALERAEQLAERKRIYELKHPETRHGAQGGRGGKKNEGASLAFSKNTAQSTGYSQRKVQDGVAIAKGIPQKLRDDLRDTDQASSQEDLRALAKLKNDPASQKKAVVAVKEGRAENIRQAIDAQCRPKKSAKDEALDALADCLKAHPDQDELRERLAFFKKAPLPVGKLLYRLK